MRTHSGLQHIAFERVAVAQALGTRPRPRSAAPRRMLVVEDDFLQAEQVAEGLRSMGLEPVGPASSLDAALALAETQELHGALLDVRLQRGLRVYPVVEVLWRRRIPFCFMTAYCEDRTSVMPAEAVLYKPFSSTALRSVVRTLLDA
ncbi:hypothetical protein KXS07_35655 [Inquilinus limosus]|uniref:hypothetical protein n=1 Tax=Inquilinus limosus TaxID=171674 RepID=UPI003F135E22